MSLNLEVRFRGMEPSDFVSARVEECASKLEKFFHHITYCKVLLEQPHHHKQQGNRFHVRIEVGVPGKKLVTNNDPGNYDTHEDAYVTIRDAFNAMRRQLQDYARILRNETKTHSEIIAETVIY